MQNKKVPDDPRYSALPIWHGGHTKAPGFAGGDLRWLENELQACAQLITLKRIA